MASTEQSRSSMQEKDKVVETGGLSAAPLPSSSPLQPTYYPQASAAAKATATTSTTAYPSLTLKSQVLHSVLKSTIKEQKLKEPPIAGSIDDVIAKTTLADRDSAKQAEKIRDEFNKEAKQSDKSCFSRNPVGRGDYLQKDEFMLGSRNRTPEIAMFNKDYNTAMSIKPDGTEIVSHGKFKHFDLYFGAHGSYVLNVPPDKFAKAWSGQKPLLFGPGPHVIKDPNFKFDPETGLVNQNLSVISHGNLHVIRVPKGSVAKVRVGTEPFVLPYREEPYVFNSPLFVMDKNGQHDFFNVSDPVIKHGPIHILRIPAGSYAKVWDGTKPDILWARDEPYIFDSPLFRIEQNGQNNFFNVSDSVIKHGPIHILRIPAGSYAKVWDGAKPVILFSREEPYIFDSPQFTLIRQSDQQPFFDASAQIIQHGTINIIRVPAGSIAKVWHGSEPELLESREEPYEFDSQQFSVEKAADGKVFIPATEKLIVHGSIKRILPPINHEAVVSDGGNLLVVKPQKDGSPTVLTSDSQRVDGFIDKSVQTVTFPSAETVAQRKRDNKDHPNYEVFRTKDSLEVGVTLLVGFQIIDLEKAIRTLGSMAGIVTHIEHLANVDMNKAIQQSSSQEFLTFYQTRPHREEGRPGNYGQTTERPPQHYQDIVKEQLADDLRKIGIEIIRLNIENPTILNKAIAAKMEEQSMLAAAANAKEAVLKQNYNIELAQADREAAILRVKQDQANQALLSTAQARLDAAKLDAAAKIAAAEGEAQALVIQAQAKQKASTLEGEMLTANPALMKMRMLELQMAALQNIKFFPPTAGTLPPGMAVNPFTMFGQWSADAAPAVVVSAAPSLLDTNKPS